MTDDAVPAGKLRTIVTFLEMAEAPRPRHRPPPFERMALLRAEGCTVSFYRYLYATVGEPWLWHTRRRLSDDALRAIIQDEKVEVFVPYVAGVPAGYVELDRRKAGQVDIAYLGLIPEFIGHGLGPWLLDWAIEAGWNGAGVTRMAVNTCTFDHPKALLMYQRAGFVPLRQEERLEDDPRLEGVMPLDAAPQIPLAEPPVR
ncbi:GNAT family N-acetyltransferase [Rhodocista pekingensis]|uniref:GNAT family N-acetyltransferase n=1 Tax=Rhodocista pekingensis TaxID=201185 RepID=A0ABW2KRJ9_9PROT